MARLNLAGRTVVMTGAAGGLGRAVAVRLRERGARLALFDLDEDAVIGLAGQLGSSEVARGWAADVTDFDGLTNAVTAAADHFDGIDVVVAAAGIGTTVPMENLEPHLFERTIDINLTGVWRTFRATLPYGSATKGHMVAISSMAAFVHTPLHGAYAATKAGVWALCDATRMEVRHRGVTVGSVHPTFFKTPMLDGVHADPAGQIIWGGNSGGLWKMVDIDDVVDGVVRGIERRSKVIVVPRRNTIVSLVPGLMRPLIDRIGYPGSTIRDAIAKSDPSRQFDGGGQSTGSPSQH